MKIPALNTQLNTMGKGITNHGIFSPVNERGSFVSDQIIKAGHVQKRTRKTKSWKPIYLVLRPGTLSMYRDSEGTKLRHRITLSDLTAAARQKDPKNKDRKVFGLYSPSRNFHIETHNDKELASWVEVIRREARIDVEDEETEVGLMSPVVTRVGPVDSFSRLDIGSAGSSASEQENGPQAAMQAKDMHSSKRRPSHTLVNYSGNENASFSDFSDTGFQDSSLSLNNAGDPREAKQNTLYQASRPQPQWNASQLSGLDIKPTDDDRVMFHGWLYLLKSKGGVRQWKSVWVVLRPKTLALYKNEEVCGIGFFSIIFTVNRLSFLSVLPR